MVVPTVSLLADPQPAAAAPAPNGSLNARVYTTSTCGFGDGTASRCHVLFPTLPWYPTMAYNSGAIRQYNGEPASCATGTQNNSASSASATNVTCNGLPAKSTANLLTSIFTGTANGAPDVPTGSQWPGGPASTNCTVTEPVLRDGAGATCGATTNDNNRADWSILEGYLYLPSDPSGTISFQATNLDSSGVAR
ncbi:MAG: hypothetical protein ACK5OX_06275, partial [Desertimonas sp.]